ncbi:MAG: hypothetical protein R3D33_06100 [Hyphomicrobiaceae bacterium]
MPEELAAGQRWSYRPPAGFGQSRLVIGAIVRFEGHEPVVCFMATAAPQKGTDGLYRPVTIPFIPMGEAAFRQTIVAADGAAAVDEAFLASYRHWKEDARGLSYFTVPFDGSLPRLIAHQMASLIAA